MGRPRQAATVRRIASGDGATVSVQTRGSGPGLVILHGGGVSSLEYRELAGRRA